MRRICTVTHTSNDSRAVVRWSSEWEEYIVQFFDDEGQRLEDADYHTSDLEDARLTAQITIEDYVETMH